MRKLLCMAVAACGMMMLSATGANAQKFGFIDMNQVAELMPEMATARENFEKVVADLQNQLEIMEVERNNLINDYQKTAATLSDALKQDKERAIQSIGDRIVQFQQTAQQELSNKQDELMEPVIDKLEAAIEKVAKANSFIAVFNVGTQFQSLAYYDKASMTDLAPMVKKELGIQ